MRDHLDGRALPRFTDRTIPDPVALEDELDRVRERGYATDVEETSRDVRCVAAAVRSYTGRTVAAISVSGYAPRLSRRRMRDLGPAVVATGLRISEKLGFRVDRRTAELVARRPLAGIGGGAGAPGGRGRTRAR